MQRFELRDKPYAGFYTFESRTGSFLLPRHRLREELHMLPFFLTAVPEAAPDSKSFTVPAALQVTIARAGQMNGLAGTFHELVGTLNFSVVRGTGRAKPSGL